MEVRFFLVNKKLKQTSVQAIVRYEGQRYKISVGESVLAKYWNTTTYRCRVVREYPEATFINQRLKDWTDVIESVFNNWGLVVPTPKMVKDEINKEKRKRSIEAGGIIDNENDQYLIAFARKFESESLKSENTKKTYKTTIKFLEKYEKHYRVKLRFIDIDIDFYNKFKKWMLNLAYTYKEQKYNYSKNYIGGQFKNIQLFMNESQGKIHDFTGHNQKGFRVEYEETDSIYLTSEELEKIYNLDITPELLIENGFDKRLHNIQYAIKSLCEERDRFLIGCFTALRHSDYSRLEDVHFKNELLGIWTIKKDKKVYVPMHHLLKKILERRINILPKPISAQKHNDQIKEIGRLAGINEEVLLTKTRGGKRTSIVGPKYSFITSHTARRSGATNMYLAGIDVKFIQDLLGHSKAETTLKYIKVSAEDNAKRLINHPYFKGNK
ncbi:tyrosine-type recombinase/integrase [Dysgonomonas sp. Marseille-P4677]|uniref:tyrosine-type recombinase/integrase n=1 Tax=Dysgonomonas sp. Marseille-P4677 TaxID=2364790 RepID=UPI001912D7E6|nr:tyrosine-type recombinase/integrase [Dysgonomonas sp. Marseille-P4677]MBK5721414.1 tyrosine-type recombinase/integrase [Dysgonomonas sp. Marseille-P4677]